MIPREQKKDARPGDFDASAEVEAAGSGEEPGSGEPGAGTAGSEEAAGSALAAAEEELARHKDALLRLQAESENLRKRLMRELERSRRMALEDIMKDLLQVRDSLERGLEMAAESATVEALLEGQGLTLKMLDKVMKDHNLEVIDPAGEPFDPELHEAMTVMPSAEVDENTVLEVLQKGFRLHDRLIRPARVVVSQKL